MEILIYQEWLWLTGYFLHAFYIFRRPQTPKRQLMHEIQRILKVHKSEILDINPYAGLPELTNSNGKICDHGCPTQAWSFATLLSLIRFLKDEYDAK